MIYFVTLMDNKAVAQFFIVSLAISTSLYYNIRMKITLMASEGSSGVYCDPIPRDPNDSAFLTVKLVKDLILYNDDIPTVDKKNSSLLETYLCDDSLKAYKDYSKSQNRSTGGQNCGWTECCAIVVRVKVPTMNPETTDPYVYLAELCKRAQDILPSILRKGWGNNMSVRHCILDADDTLSFSIIAYGAENDPVSLCKILISFYINESNL